MSDEWKSSADYDQRKFANEEEDDAPDSWDIDEDAVKKEKEQAEKAAAAAAAAAKAARDAAKDKAPKKLTKKEERAQREEAEKKARQAEEAENNPLAKAKRRQEQEEMARKRDNEFADDLFGGKGRKAKTEEQTEEYDGEEGDYEEGDYEEGEEDEEYPEEEEEEEKPAKKSQLATSKPAVSKPPTTTVAAATKPSAPVATAAAVSASVTSKVTVEKKEDLGYKVLDFKAAPVPVKPIASPSSSSSSSIESLPLLSDEHFNSFALQLSKKLRSLSPAVNTPSVHSARLVRFLRTVLQAAADVMTVDDVNEVKKSLMSIQQQKTTAMKQLKATPTVQKTATGRAAVGSNTLGRDIRATLNLKDDDDMLERNQATQAAARDAELEDFM